MQFFGNDTDPLAKTLKDLGDKTSESHIGNAGNFFDPVHERDNHVKPPQNAQHDVLEFNAALLTVDDPSTMLDYIILRNKITEEECYIIEETNHVDKTSGETTVFIKWFQPKGSFELGTARFKAGCKLRKEEVKEENTPSEILTKDKSIKGSRKWNKKVKL